VVARRRGGRCSTHGSGRFGFTGQRETPLGQWQDTEKLFKAAVDAYSRARPAYVGGPLAGLAELRRRQGRWEEAEQLLGHAAALVCRSRLALDRGDARQAQQLAERALRQAPAQMIVHRATALEALLAAAVASGNVQQANVALTELKQVARFADTVPLHAAVHLGDGMVSAATGDHKRARPLLEDAVDEFERSSAPFEAAQARLELAKSLIALGRRAEAAQEAQASLARFTELGAQAEASRARTVLHMSPGGSRPSTSVPEVSRREREVLRSLADGLTNRQIADRLFVSERRLGFPGDLRVSRRSMTVPDHSPLEGIRGTTRLSFRETVRARFSIAVAAASSAAADEPRLRPRLPRGPGVRGDQQHSTD
jgi:ATP/maltotriose-dependent transcriptional regulator MalT